MNLLGWSRTSTSRFYTSTSYHVNRDGPDRLPPLILLRLELLVVVWLYTKSSLPLVTALSSLVQPPSFSTSPMYT